jgi:hypothetical protein
MNDKQKEHVRKLRSIGYSYRKISVVMHLNINSVKSFCQRNGLGGAANPPARPADYSGDVTFCANCGNEIHQQAKRKKKKFCCDECRNEWWNSHPDAVDRKAWYEFTCKACGKTFMAYGAKNRKYCSFDCYINDRFSTCQNE